MTQAAKLAQLGSPGISTGFKNRIINGAMVIDQRNAGASVSIVNAVPTYTTDRWQVFENGSMSFTAQQSSTAPEGFSKSLLVTSTAAVTPGSSDRSALTQVIEGFNIADFGWGTANAKTVTLSFWVRSSLTGQFGGSLQNAAQDYSYPFSFTINSANTFEYKTITITAPTAGTWNSDNSGGVRLAFDLGMGSGLLGAPGSWQSADYRGATGDTRINGTNGATFYITGVQLEVGTTATDFEYRDYGRELMMCQRYFEKVDSYDANSGFWSGEQTNGQTYFITISYCVTKRAGATVTIDGTSNSGFGTVTPSGASISGFRTSSVATVTSSMGYFRAIWSASAEL